jgi:hypothetical protein
MSLILSGTDGVADVDGSAASPAIRGTDANTGIFFPAADTVAISEGGVESVRFDSNGNSLFGTTTNTNNSRVVSNGVVESTTGGFRFPDGTTQTTAATAPTTATVLAATAGASVGEVGTYALLVNFSGPNTQLAPGTTTAGSGLRYSAANQSYYTGTPSGTWRIMGVSSANVITGETVATSVWLRIS